MGYAISGVFTGFGLGAFLSGIIAKCLSRKVILILSESLTALALIGASFAIDI